MSNTISSGCNTWEWTGTVLQRTSGSRMHDAFEFKGGRWSSAIHDSEKMFTWHSDTMTPNNGDESRAIKAHAGGSFGPPDGSQENAWSKCGNMLMGRGQRCSMTGSIPDAVIAGFVATYLNVDLWSGGGGGGGDEHFDVGASRYVIDPNAIKWGEPKSEHTVWAFCKEHPVGLYSNPRAGKCHGCEEALPEGVTVYRCDGCDSDKRLCTTCAGKLMEFKKHPSHTHPMITFTHPIQPMKFKFMWRRPCLLCKEPSGDEGAYCKECNKWICQKCYPRSQLNPCGCSVQ